MQRRRIVAVFMAVAALTALSLTVASPASADTAGALRNTGNRMCLKEASSQQGASVIQVTCPPDPIVDRSMHWDYICIDSSCSRFHIRNEESLLCMDVFGSASNGTAVIMWPCSTISNENWDSPSGPPSPNFTLRSRVSNTSSHCLDVPFQQTTENLALQIWGCNLTVAQQFFAGPFIIE